MRHDAGGLVHECDFPAAEVQGIVFWGRYGDDFFRNDTAIASTAIGSDGRDTLIGGSGDDRLVGDRDADSLEGRGGNDTLEGGSEDDRLEGGGGNDRVFGGTGNDRLFGGNGSDELHGQDGDDHVEGGNGDDLLTGSNGRDTLLGGGGDDRLYGDRDEDLLDGGAGADLLDGGGEDDRLMGGAGADNLDGGSGNDELQGGDGHDVLNGGHGDDRLIGEDGNDQLFGSLGHDSLWGNAGDDMLDAGPGSDLLDGGGGDDVLSGGSEDDYLDGGTGDDHLDGGSGNDFLLAGEGADHAKGGEGDDVIYGGDGNDRLDGSLGADVLVGGLGNDFVDGGPDDDLLYGSPGDDEVYGRSGDDRLAGGDGRDLLDGGGGRDVLEGEGGDDSLNGGGEDDVLHGGEGNDYLNGRDGNDILLGGNGNDTLLGIYGNDVLVGDAGADVLDAGADNDVLIGGEEADTLYGGSGDDLLIGGRTQYDHNQDALRRIRDIWTSSLPYEARIAALEDHQFAALLKSEQTVFDDAVTDEVVGNDGSDWFFLTGAMRLYTPGHSAAPSHPSGAHNHHHGGSHTTTPPSHEGFAFVDSLDRLRDTASNERIHTIVPHGTDPSKLGEHFALFELVRYDQVTHVAAGSGDWTSPSTWQHGRVPASGANVLIPAGVHVRVDGLVSAELRTLRVDGTLRFDTQRNTELRVDTLVISVGGALEMGTAKQPIRGDVSARLLIADRGPINRDWDPFGLSRGLIAHGRVEIHGAAKTSHAAVMMPPLAGNTVLVLSQAPQGWRRGDQVVIAGTDAAGGQDEVREILSVEGAIVRLTSPLAYDHVSSDVTQQVHIANLSRNAVVESENPTLDRRGHVMLMHTRDVDLNYAGFYHLGRANKLEVVNDPIVDSQWNLQEGTGTNPRGRYAVHFHRNGVNNDGNPATVHGSVVWGSPGWGYVNHSSFVDISNSVSYDVDGSGFVTEAGDEIGSFRNNIAIRSRGSGEDVNSRVMQQDFGHEGNGYWFQGTGVAVTGNVAAGHSGNAFIFYTRGLNHGSTSQQMFPAENLPDPRLAHGAEVVDTRHVPIAEFRGNVGYASGTGLHIRYHLRDAAHMTQSVFEKSVFWNNRTGITLPYTQNVILRSIRVVRPFASSEGTGIDGNLVTEDITYDDMTVIGYHRGIDLPRAGYAIVREGFFNNEQNIVVRMAARPGRLVHVTGNVRFGAFPQELLGRRTQYEVYMRPDYEMGRWGLSHVFAKGSVTLNYGRFSNTPVYFQTQQAHFVPFTSQLPDLPSKYVGLTNQQLYNRFGVRISDGFAPTNAVQDPRIFGLVAAPR